MQQTIRAEASVDHGACHDEQLQPAATFVSPPHPWGALVTACIALFLIAVNTTAINTAVSAIADDLSISSSTLAWALNAYLLAVAAFVVLGGQLGDVLGRQRIFVIGIVVYTLGAIVVAASGSAAVLIGGRGLQGLGAAVLTWRWVWWSNVPVAIVALLLARPMLRGLPSGERGVRFDVPGIALLAVGLFTAILALQQGGLWGWTSPLLLALLGVAAVTLTAFVVVELRAQSPLVHLRLLRNRVFTAGNAGTFAGTVGLIGILYFFNLYAQSSVLLDYSALVSGLALLPFGLGIFAGSLVSGRVADRIGARIPVLNHQLDAAGVPRPEEETLDQVFTGSPSAISSEANTLQGEQRAAFIS